MNDALMAVVPAAVKRVKAGGPDSYYEGLVKSDFSPGWARPEPSIWPKPKDNFEPSVWRYKAAREALDLAGGYVPMELTERRNLLMVNPVEGNLYATARNIVAAYQMIQPGEVADDHRHTPHALRLILDGAAPVYTVVNGVRIDMEPGDVVLTPAWHWHGHANESSERAYWIDFLDVPLVQHLEGMFFEEYEVGFRKPESSEPDSPFRFPTNKIIEQSGALKKSTVSRLPIDAPQIPSMALTYVVLPAGKATDPMRESANNLYAVINGSIDIEIEGETITAERGDVVCAPLWKSHRIEARGGDAVLLNVSDRPVFQFLGTYKSE